MKKIYHYPKKRYFHYSVSKAQDFQEHLNNLLETSPTYLGDEINLTTSWPDINVILFNKEHHDERIDIQFHIEMLLKNGGEVTIVNRNEIHVNDYSLNIDQLHFIEKIVNDLAEFKDSLEYIKLEVK